MNKIKRQHYVPKFYLNEFTLNNNGQLFVLNKDTNKIFCKNILEVCEQNYYYSHKDNMNKCNEYNFLVEEMLSKKEHEFSLIFDKIISNIEGYYYYSKDIDMLTRKERLIFLEFLYYQILRVPKYIDRLFVKGKIFLKELNKKHNYIQNDKEKINDLKKIMFPILFDNIDEFVSIMNKRNWAFFIINKSINKYFVSSDNPVIIANSEFNVDRVGIIDSMTEVTIPISKNILLAIRETYIKHKIECHIINSIDIINKINIKIKNNSTRFVYSELECLLK